MRAAPLGVVAEAMGGALVGASSELASAPVCGATVDSRLVRAGQLFFALKGRTDGADFAPEALLRGAVAAVADRPLPDIPTVVVRDPLAALGELARKSLSHEEKPPAVVGITGTVGKTTTKDALAVILRASGRRVWATEGNFNNEIGLPLTVLSAPVGTEILVLEMGATRAGDIAYLCRIAPPTVGVLTAVSPVHLDSFGSLEELAVAKGELALALPENGVLVHPANAPETAAGPGRTFDRRITFGDEPEADLYAEEIAEREAGLSFTLRVKDERSAREESVRVEAPVFGTHLVQPLLAAVGGALAFGTGPDVCARGLRRLRRTGLRGEVYRLRDGITVYDDSYNASPAAVAAVLRYGAQEAQRRGGRLIAVLGGMFELGGGARGYHHEAGRLAWEVGVDLLVCVGDEARWYAEAFPGNTARYGDVVDAVGGLEEALEAGDYVVVKGSRGVGLDLLTRKLKEKLALV